MKRTASVLLAFLFFTSNAVLAQQNPLDELDWQVGPVVGTIGTKAVIDVPEGFVFLDAQETKKLMEIMENIPNENEYVLAPNDLSWYAVFEFSAVGYVQDDETIDAKSLLDAVTQGNEAGNVERRNRGWDTLTILGWKFQPRYDNQSNRLEWAFLAKNDSNNGQVVNYNTRMLGRTGVMEAVVVADPASLDSAVAQFKEVVKGYQFNSGETYADYRQGDRVAEFGLAALITGGVAAVATKKGFWAAIAGFFGAAWKLVVAGVIAVLASIKGLFRRKA